MGHPAALTCLRGPYQTDTYVLGRAVVLRLRVMLPFVAWLLRVHPPLLRRRLPVCTARCLSPFTTRMGSGFIASHRRIFKQSSVASR
jgi:hypothetical protein